VPVYLQRTNECGPAALSMILAWSGVEAPLEQLALQVYTPKRRGTLTPALVAAARERGRVPVEVPDLDGILAEVAAGRPVLVLQNLGAGPVDLWHFAVVVGFDLDTHEVVLHAGQAVARRQQLRAFARSFARADRWARVVLAPDQLPVADDETGYLEAAAGLERAGRAGDAKTAYQTALGRWPESLEAWLGLGNTRFAVGDVAGSEQAFRRAVELHPSSGIAHNNLAYVLLQQGRVDEARVEAERAVRIGGPLSEEFKETLEAIEAEP
jgi:tetratricopeptide (TPR) repeat protein